MRTLSVLRHYSSEQLGRRGVPGNRFYIH